MRLKEYKKAGTVGDKKTYAYNYLISKGLPAVQSAGIIGNLHAESGLNTTIKGTADDKGSVGLAQWHSKRKTGLYNFAKSQGKSWDKLEVQLDFILHELKTTEKDAFKSLQAARTPQEATMAFMNDYERPAEWAKAKSGRGRVNAALELSGMAPDPNFQAQGYDQQDGPQGGTDAAHQFSTMYGDDFYNTDRSQNVSSLDRSQEIANLAQEKQDRATEIKARLDQKAAEKTFMAEMIQKSQVAYVNPADFLAQSAPRAPQEEQFQKGGSIPVSSRGVYDYPNQEVIVPTNEGRITMRNVDYPILGISKETGEKRWMMPNTEHYYKNTKNVLEIPLSKFII